MSYKEITEDQMKDFVKAFSDFTNNMSHDYDGKLSDAFVESFFQEHRYLQGEMLFFIFKLLGKIGKRSGNPMWEDARNASWIKWAKDSNDIKFI
jgi:hypothetical protein